MIDRTSSRSDPNANGAFVFTGLYSAGNIAGRVAGADFADFLLGQTQQATLQYGPGDVRLRGRSTSLFFQDDWRQSAKLTLSLGVRYELIAPYTEAGGHLVNLDVPPDFTAAVPVLAGATGPFTGAFPAALVRTDRNNLAPRARRGLSREAGPDPARRLRHQLQLRRLFDDRAAAREPAALRVDRHGARHRARPPLDRRRLRRIDRQRDDQQLRHREGLRARPGADVERRRVEGPSAAWTTGGGYTRTTGASLDIVRAPNRGPLGLRIPDVQAFNWQTAEGDLGAERRHVPAAAPHGQRDRRERDLYARQVDGQRLEHRRRRDRRRAERSGSRGGVFALELRSAPPGLVRPVVRAPLRPEQALAAQRRADGGGARRLARLGQLHLAVGDAVHAARDQRGHRRLARHQRDVAGQLQRRRRSRWRTRPSRTSSTRRRSRFRSPAPSATRRAT